MRDVLAVFQQETGNIYNLEATPAESTAYRFAMLDTKRYPDIITANQADRLLKGAKPYYTNSTHLPVNFTDDLYEALEMQDPLQALYTGGTVFHVFTGESAVSPAAARDMVRRVAGSGCPTSRCRRRSASVLRTATCPANISSVPNAAARRKYTAVSSDTCAR